MVVNENVVDIPKHAWQQAFKAVVRVEAPENGVYYPVFIVRHSQKYDFENILIRLTAQDSAAQPLESWDLNIPLMDKNNFWKGQRMDDLYDYRIKVTPAVSLKAGTYRFVIGHQMGQNPLENILNVGIALHKAD